MSTPINSTINFQAIFDALPNSYIVFEPNEPLFTIVAENKSHARVGLVDPKDVIGKPLLEAFPDTSEKYLTTGVSDLVESFKKVNRTGKPDLMPLIRYDLHDKNGKLVTRYWRVKHYPLFIGRKLTYIYQSTEDVTNEVVSETKLKQAKQQLDEALSVGLIGTWLWDIQRDIVIGDKYMANMFGVKTEEAAAGLPLSMFVNAIYEPDRLRVNTEISQALKTGSKFESEYRTINHAGLVSWVIARGRIERDKNNDPLQFPGVLVDISERKQAEINLAYLSRASKVLASSFNFEKTYVEICNMLVPEIADWCMIDVINNDKILTPIAGASHSTIWPDKLTKPAPFGAEKVIQTAKSVHFQKVTPATLKKIVNDDENLEKLLNLNISSIVMSPIITNGDVKGVFTLVAISGRRTYTHSDVEMAEELANRAGLALTNARLYNDSQQELHKRIKLEEELRLTNEELERRVENRTAELEKTNTSLHRSNQELQDFAYVASHDLQEPLRKIQAFGNLLESEYSVNLGDGSDYLRRMRGAAARMSSLIEDILSFRGLRQKLESLKWLICKL